MVDLDLKQLGSLTQHYAFIPLKILSNEIDAEFSGYVLQISSTSVVHVFSGENIRTNRWNQSRLLLLFVGCLLVFKYSKIGHYWECRDIRSGIIVKILKLGGSVVPRLQNSKEISRNHNSNASTQDFIQAQAWATNLPDARGQESKPKVQGKGVYKGKN